jgi:hypothetical protein
MDVRRPVGPAPKGENGLSLGLELCGYRVQLTKATQSIQNCFSDYRRSSEDTVLVPRFLGFHGADSPGSAG